MNVTELRGLSFACLEGCGFCCTFQPEASNRELALLRKRLAPNPVPITVGADRTYLQLHNKCGACTLLDRRGCQAYDLRPAHCRYFPFHVHFADETEAYVNRTCRGVEDAPDGDLAAAFASSVTANARKEDVARHERLAREAYGAFERKARRARKWGDADATLARVLAAGPALFRRAWIERACAEAGEPASAEDAIEDALVTFGDEDVTRRPFYLAPDLRWLTFERPTPATLRVLEMDERGNLTPVRDLPHGAGNGWRDLPDATAEGLARYLSRLATRRLFVGTAYALVDDSDYALAVEDAVKLRVAEVVVDLALRARILQAMDVPPQDIPAEVERFYDSTFLDAPTIGGWL